MICAHFRQLAWLYSLLLLGCYFVTSYPLLCSPLPSIGLTGRMKWPLEHYMLTHARKTSSASFLASWSANILAQAWAASRAAGELWAPCEIWDTVSVMLPHWRYFHLPKVRGSAHSWFLQYASSKNNIKSSMEPWKTLWISNHPR